MKTKLEVLYTRRRNLYGPNDDPPESAQTPVVRFADACAAIGKLEAELDRTERLRVNAVARCEFLLAELKRAALKAESVDVPAPLLGRWDTLPKAL